MRNEHSGGAVLLTDELAGELMRNSHEERVTTPRRCAWCLRFWAGGAWVDGRRAEDEAVLPAATHTICEACVEELRRKGLSL